MFIRTSFDYSDLIECAHGRLFGPRAPRLPAPPLLAFDTVTDVLATGGCHGKGLITAVKDVPSLAWVFDSHFPQDPVLPGALMLDGLLQLTGFFAAYLGCCGKGRAARISEAQFVAEVRPDQLKLTYRVEVRRCLMSKGIIVADGLVTADHETCVKASGLWITVGPA